MADGSTIHSFRSLAEAHEFVKLEEIKSCMKYVLVARTRDATVTGMDPTTSIKMTKGPGNDTITRQPTPRSTTEQTKILPIITITGLYVQSFDGFLIKFEDTRGEVPVAYDGVPFIQLGTEVRECHQGPDRKKKRKEASLEESGDHEYSGKNRRKRSCIQTSKKLGCTAKVKFRMLIRFPRFKINGPDSRKSRKEIVQRLKDATLTDYDKKYSVLVRFCGQHHDHVIGEDAGYGQPLDASVISKIKSLVVDDGLRNAGEIQKHIELIRKNVPECPKTNRRFNPSLQDIRFHMSAAIHCNRLYWNCEECNGWFHPSCLGLDEKDEPEQFYCNACKEAEKRVSEDEEETEDTEETFLYKKSDVKTLIHIAIDRVKEIISGKNLDKPWLEKHQSFLVGERPVLRGYGYSWFSVTAILYVEELLMKHFYTDKTDQIYTRHGKITGMKDEEMNAVFEGNPYLASSYVSEICVPEALAGIMSSTLHIPYEQADALLRETEDKSLIQAMRKGLEKSENNKKRWEAVFRKNC